MNFNSQAQTETSRFDSFISIADMKKRLGVNSLPIVEINNGDSNYYAVTDGSNVIALCQGDLDTNKPMAFGVYTKENVERLRLVNVKRQQSKVVVTL